MIVKGKHVILVERLENGFKAFSKIRFHGKYSEFKLGGGGGHNNLKASGLVTPTHAT